MDFFRSMLDFGLPALGLALYPEYAEEVVHREADAPADQREEEPQEPWHDYQVQNEQQDVDQHINGRMNVEAHAPLLRSHLGFSSLIVLKSNSFHHFPHLLPEET